MRLPQKLKFLIQIMRAQICYFNFSIKLAINSERMKSIMRP